jgi:hypothetical protein
MSALRPIPAALLGCMLAPTLHAAVIDVSCTPATKEAELVAAFTAVEANGDAANTINLAQNCLYTLAAATPGDNAFVGDNGVPRVIRPQTLTINGNGATVERSAAGGTPEFRLMQFGLRSGQPPAGNLIVTLNDLTVRNGRVFTPEADGAGFKNGGGVYFQGDPGDELYVNRSRFSGNTADSGGGLGAASFAGNFRVEIVDSEFDGNRAVTSGGGLQLESPTGWVRHSIIRDNTVDPSGAAPFDGHTGAGGFACYGCFDVELADSTVTGNSAIGIGAGGVLVAGTGRLNAGLPPYAMRILRTRIEDNSATQPSTGPAAGRGGDGGGLVLMEGFFDLPAEVDVVDSAILNNSAANRGGGIATAGDNTDADEPPSRIRLINSTLSGNSATVAAGGIAIGGAQVSLINTTVTANSAQHAGGVGIGHYDYAGLFFSNPSPSVVTVGSARFINSIVGGNTSTAAGFEDCAIEEDTVADGGGVVQNLFSLVRLDAPNQAPVDYRCGATYPFALTANPLLGPLANNGGLDPSHMPQAGSPVLDAGSAASIPADLNLATDQRGAGFVRVFGAAIDLGSIEAGLPRIFADGFEDG